MMYPIIRRPTSAGQLGLLVDRNSGDNLKDKLIKDIYSLYLFGEGSITTLPKPRGGGGGGGVTSTHNKRGCAILTKKVASKNPGAYLKLRPKNPETRNARLSFYMRKLTTQIR